MPSKSRSALDSALLVPQPGAPRYNRALLEKSFSRSVHDKALIQEARHISHLRNATCHMSNVSPDELPGVRPVMRDWFRVVSL
jgi:hypothetical protein